MRVAIAQIETRESFSRIQIILKDYFKEAADRKANLIVFPELFNTPFLLDKIDLNRKDSQRILDLIRKLCEEQKIWCVAGTLAIEDRKKLYNRSYIVDARGQIRGFYDKIHGLEVHARHDFIESDLFEAGDHLFNFRIGDFQFGLLVCYDVRFPELARLYAGKVDGLIIPAAFNEAIGKKHWKALMQTRAIENQVYVIAVNPARKEYPGYVSYGHSMVVDPQGKIILELDAKEELCVVDLDLEEVKRIRDRSPYLKQRRNGLYRFLEELKNEY